MVEIPVSETFIIAVDLIAVGIVGLRICSSTSMASASRGPARNFRFHS
jgi:hypothetical protein